MSHADRIKHRVCYKQGWSRLSNYNRENYASQMQDYNIMGNVPHFEALQTLALP